MSKAARLPAVAGQDEMRMRVRQPESEQSTATRHMVNCPSRQAACFDGRRNHSSVGERTYDVMAEGHPRRRGTMSQSRSHALYVVPNGRQLPKKRERAIPPRRRGDDAGGPIPRVSDSPPPLRSAQDR